MPELLLTGCAPVPLAHYLKALGIFRLVAEQKDPNAKGSWERDVFKLHSNLDREALLDFFLKEYRPTPVLAPWNGGSGFYPKDNKKALEAITNSTHVRFDAYRKAITSISDILLRYSITEKSTDEKANLLMACRNELANEALSWLDAVYVLGQDGPKYPPLLGTGGNDGRLDFTNNFMHWITEVLELGDAHPSSHAEHWLNTALFTLTAPGQSSKAAIGQFLPGSSGGANSGSGFNGSAQVNPWDFVLMIEGAVLFAAASVKKLESANDGSLVYPFCVRQTGVGYVSASRSDESNSRSEMWMPLWSRESSLSEVRAVFSEGRAQVRGKAARTGIDLAQAAVSLGVDRGIDAFQRYGFQVRNGLSYFATPLDRVLVRRNARVDLLADIEQWYDRLRMRCSPSAKPEAPNSVVTALTALERSIMDLCQDGSNARMSALLAALGRTQRAVARSSKWASDPKVNIKPACGLRPQWLTDADDGSVEYRLAASLAGVRALLDKDMLHMREHLEPVVVKGGKDRSWVEWAERPSNDVVWHNGDPIDALNAVLGRRVMRTQQAGVAGWQDRSPIAARLEDITAFIERRTDDALLVDLLWGLSLLDWQQVDQQQQESDVEERAVPSALYALLKLCFHPARKDEDAIPLVPDIARRAMQGDGVGASTVAARRLRASGLAPLVTELPVSNASVRRTAAALLFPISSRDRWLLQRAIIHEPTNLEHA